MLRRAPTRLGLSAADEQDYDEMAKKVAEAKHKKAGDAAMDGASTPVKEDSGAAGGSTREARASNVAARIGFAK